MSTEDFLHASTRELADAERGKALYWREYKRRHGAAAGIRIADELRRQIAAQRPDWPCQEQRGEDHAAHLKALDAFERVASSRR